jgi:hypothetical protein
MIEPGQSALAVGCAGRACSIVVPVLSPACNIRVEFRAQQCRVETLSTSAKRGEHRRASSRHLGARCLILGPTIQERGAVRAGHSCDVRINATNAERAYLAASSAG